MSDLLDAARGLAASIVADRREIHAHPELAYKEERTSRLVQDRLRELGIPFRGGVGGTGVIGLIEGGRPGRCVLLRADMDALPITEESGYDFASRNPGVMHACGHDSHTAILLGVARMLLERRAEFSGSVKLMFQPAEEGGAGAVKMIEAGLLEDPHVDAAFMLHVDHDLFAGTVGTAPGPVLAGANHFTIAVEGRGGHASRPHLAVDPIVAAAQIVTAVQTLVAREVAPGVPAVVTLGSLQAGTAPNVIPDRAFIRGTVRAYDADLMKHIERRLEEVSSGVAQGLRASAKVSYEMHYPPTVNDAAMAELLAGAARSAIGEHVVEMAPKMAAEDFSFVLERVPGACLSLGVRSPEWTEIRPVHTPRFDLDESALPYGAAAMAAVAVEFLAG